MHGLIPTRLFLSLYSLFRFIVENFREPDVQIGFYAEFITQGQILCIPMLAAGLLVIKYSYRSHAD